MSQVMKQEDATQVTQSAILCSERIAMMRVAPEVLRRPLNSV
jgi:hypothetical protein